MATEPIAPPEAALIAERRKEHLPRMSMRGAVAAAGELDVKMSEAGWRSIETGRYEAPADKLAIMAMVVGVTPDELDDIGRDFSRSNATQAAALLRAYLRRRAASEPALADVHPDSAPEVVLQMLLEGIDAIRRADVLSDDQKLSLERSLINSVTQTVAVQIVQNRTTIELVQDKARQT